MIKNLDHFLSTKFSKYTWTVERVPRVIKHEGSPSAYSRVVGKKGSSQVVMIVEDWMELDQVLNEIGDMVRINDSIHSKGWK